MKKILIATHGTFASGAESTVKFLMGDVGNITCINAYVDQDENFGGDTGTVFCPGSAGGPGNCAHGYQGGECEPENRTLRGAGKMCFLIAGFNLPLLVALAIAPQGITREDVRQYIEDSKKQMETGGAGSG